MYWGEIQFRKWDYSAIKMSNTMEEVYILTDESSMWKYF